MHPTFRGQTEYQDRRLKLSKQKGFDSPHPKGVCINTCGGKKRSELMNGLLDGGVGGRQCARLGHVNAMGRAQGVGGRRRAVGGRRLPGVQHRPPGKAVGGELGPLVVEVELEDVESRE